MLLLLLSRGLRAQLSQPLAHDSQVDEQANKFLQRDVSHSTDGGKGDEEELMECPLNVALSWMTEVSSSVYATPLITDLYSDGAKEIVVPSFVHYLEVLEGEDGASSSGWPAFHKSSTHTSPLLVDVDFDGVEDIAMATYDGQILFFKDNGEQLQERLTVPRLRVRRDWHVGLNMDHVDHSHPDVSDPGISKEAAQQEERLRRAKEKAAREAAAHEPLRAPPQVPEGGGHSGEEAVPAVVVEGRLEEQPPAVPQNAGGDAVPEKARTDEAASSPPPDPVKAQVPPSDDPQVPEKDKPQVPPPDKPDLQQANGETAEEQATARRHLLAEEATAEIDPKVKMDPEAEDSFKVFEDEGEEDYPAGEEDYETARHGGDPYYDDHYIEDDYMPYDDDMLPRERAKMDHEDVDYDGDEFWDNEDFEEDAHANDMEYVMVDAHILCTPAIADIDGDGHEEMVVAVSYFYDHEYYDNPEHMKELGEDMDISNYVASGIVAFQISSRFIKWSQHLDLTTDFTKYRAYVYSSPTLADINRDGKMEIVVGTSVGFLYVLDSAGEPLEGWPVQMGEIQGQPLVADLNGDGYMEIFAADSRGNTALFNYRGHELWERHVGGLVSQMATAGDVNGDGALEIVFGTATGEIHVVSGRTGEELPQFPFRTGVRVMAPVLITKLQDHTASQHLVVTAFDGLLYMIDGATGCADTVDIGEVSYAMVLADDLNGNGKMDLLVSTMNGNVYAFETASEYHPLKVWNSQLQGCNNMVARYGYQGIYATPATRMPRDVRGQTLSVRFDILDNRPPALMPSQDAAGEPKSLRGPYRVTVTLVGVGVEEMNMGDQPVIGMMDTFDAPGTYTMEIPCPRTRSTATVRIDMADESQIIFSDEFSLSFHIHFYRLFKWMVLLPFTMMAAVVLSMDLPSAAEGGLPLAMATRIHDA